MKNMKYLCVLIVLCICIIPVFAQDISKEEVPLTLTKTQDIQMIKEKPNMSVVNIGATDGSLEWTYDNIYQLWTPHVEYIEDKEIATKGGKLSTQELQLQTDNIVAAQSEPIVFENKVVKLLDASTDVNYEIYPSKVKETITLQKPASRIWYDYDIKSVGKISNYTYYFPNSTEQKMINEGNYNFNLTKTNGSVIRTIDTYPAKDHPVSIEIVTDPKYVSFNNIPAMGGLKIDVDGNTKIFYPKPIAIDAEGTIFELNFVLDKNSETLSIVGDLSNAIYPVNVDPTGNIITTDISTIYGDVIIKWTYSGTNQNLTWTSPVSSTVNVWYLLVGAGGGTSGYLSGGGGAGGVLNGTISVTSNTTYNISVGYPILNNSGNSSVFGGLTALGGGRGAQGGGATGDLATSGGSGGGGGSSNVSTQKNGGAGTAGQGYAGGNSQGSGGRYGSGGGGGCADVGDLGTQVFGGGDGGIGCEINITGIKTYYGGGGGGGSVYYGGSGVGLGAPGGGGDGAVFDGMGAVMLGGTSGTNNLGGGSGGGNDEYNQRTNLLSGGSGVVIIRYNLSAPTSSFTVTNNSGAFPLTTTFLDNSSGIITTWNWSFGDGTYASTQNATHLYSTKGIYDTTLTVENDAGSSTSTVTSITVTDPATTSWDTTTHNLGDTGYLTYTIDGAYWNTGSYSYKISIYDLSSNLKQEKTIASQNGSESFYFSGLTYSTGYYYAYLSRTKLLPGEEPVVLNDPPTQINLVNIVQFRGNVNNSENGTPLNANVSITQGSTSRNQILTNGTYDTLTTNFITDSALTFNVTLANYRNYSYTFTPTTSKTYYINFSLVPTTPTYTGASIGGVFRSPPYNIPISGATITISNATYSNTNTTNAFGYYRFDSLKPNSNYTIHGTKSGYILSQDYTVTAV